jgi:hypothetical protein
MILNLKIVKSLNYLNNYLFEDIWEKTEKERYTNVINSIQKCGINMYSTHVNNLQLVITLKEKYNVKVKIDEIEIPDEFCDPIMQSLIEDPVYLPNTDIIMDKAIIARHLITDQHNPFNREELDMNKLEEYNQLPEILKKISIFKDKLKDWKDNI